MTTVPLLTWYWVGGITVTILTLVGLSIWYNYFWNPHQHSKNL